MVSGLANQVDIARGKEQGLLRYQAVERRFTRRRGGSEAAQLAKADIYIYSFSILLINVT